MTTSVFCLCAVVNAEHKCLDVTKAIYVNVKNTGKSLWYFAIKSLQILLKQSKLVAYAPTVCIHKLQDELTDFTHQEKCVWVSLTQHLPDSNTASTLLRWSHMLQLWLISLQASIPAIWQDVQVKADNTFSLLTLHPSVRERGRNLCSYAHTDSNTFCYTGLFFFFLFFSFFLCIW